MERFSVTPLDPSSPPPEYELIQPKYRDENAVFKSCEHILTFKLTVDDVDAWSVGRAFELAFVKEENHGGFDEEEILKNVANREVLEILST